MDEFSLDDDGARADYGGGFVADHEYVVGVITRGDKVVAGVKFGERWFAYRCEDAESWEEACRLNGSVTRALETDVEMAEK